MWKTVTHSAEETVGLGARLGNLLDPGDFIALIGELGSGKTQFAKGVSAGLVVDTSVPVTSPTYTLINEYRGCGLLVHMDLYRIHSTEEAAVASFPKQP